MLERREKGRKLASTSRSGSPAPKKSGRPSAFPTSLLPGAADVASRMAARGNNCLPWALLRNSDATIRERAAALLRGLLVTPAEADAATPEQRERAGLVLAFAGDAPDKVAASVTAALGDADPGVRAAGLEALAALRAARADDRKLREALENAGAETALGDAAADYGEWIRGA